MIVLELNRDIDVVVFVWFVSKATRRLLISRVHWDRLIRMHHWYFDKNTPKFKQIAQIRAKEMQFYQLVKERDQDDFGIPSFGTCDSPHQLASLFPKFKGHVWMNAVYRCDYPDKTWRWHKWGKYLGEHKEVSSYRIEWISEANGKKGKPRIDVTWTFSRTEEKWPYEKYWFENGNSTPLH